MARRIRWSPKAADGFEEICNYIAMDSVHYARIFAKKVNALIKEIPRFHRAGRIVPEYQDENLRERIFQNYRIVYRINGDVIEIVVISHSARQLKI